MRKILAVFLFFMCSGCMSITNNITPPSGGGSVEISCTINKELPITPSIKADGNTVTPKLVP